MSEDILLDSKLKISAHFKGTKWEKRKIHMQSLEVLPLIINKFIKKCFNRKTNLKFP